MLNREFSAKFCGFFFPAATDSEHKIIQILHRKGQNKIWTELSSLGQEPTFKSEQAHTDIFISNSLLGKPLELIIPKLAFINCEHISCFQ